MIFRRQDLRTHECACVQAVCRYAADLDMAITPVVGQGPVIRVPVLFALRTAACPVPCVMSSALSPHSHAVVDSGECILQAMTYFTKLSLIGGEVPLESAYDWSSARCIMDVGGGRGEMLSRCMAAAGPAARGVLMDRPWVLDR